MSNIEMAMLKALLVLQRDDVRGPLQLILQSHSGPHSDSPHLFPQTATLQADIFSWESHNQTGLYQSISIFVHQGSYFVAFQSETQKTDMIDRYVIHIC